MDDRDNSRTLSLVEDDHNDIEFTLVALREGIFVARDEKNPDYLFHRATYRSQAVENPKAAPHHLNDQPHSAVRRAF
jgi:hypothetical protein